MTVDIQRFRGFPGYIVVYAIKHIPVNPRSQFLLILLKEYTEQI